MKMKNTKQKIPIFLIFITFFLFDKTKSDLLVRSPEELKSQFISNSFSYKYI